MVEHAVKVGAEAILTFDARGVTRHPNHVACYQGLIWARSAFTARRISMWTLQSPRGVLKYLGLLGATLWVWMEKMRLGSGAENPRLASGGGRGGLRRREQEREQERERGRETGTSRSRTVVHVWGRNTADARRAMRAHASQWVWYRKLYVYVACLMYVNVLVLEGSRVGVR